MKPEAQLQKQIVSYLKQMASTVIVAASMNGMPIFAKNAAVYVKHQKSLGMLVGFPDLQLMWNSDGETFKGCKVVYPPRTLFLEIKSPKGKLSPMQAAVRADLTNMGFPYEMIKSWEGFIEAIHNHSVPVKGVKL